MEAKCDKCNRVFPIKYLKMGITTDEVLCPECYKRNKTKTALFSIGTITMIVFILWVLFTMGIIN